MRARFFYLILGLLLAGGITVSAQSIPTISPWLYFGGGTKAIRTVSTSTQVVVGASATSTASKLETPSLTITGLATGGNPCLTVSASGVVSTQSCAGSSGLTSINGETGPAITIAAGSNISIATSTNTITISGTGGSGGSGTVTTSTPASVGYFPTWGTTSALTGTSTAYLSGSNIGIGTTAPSSSLHVVGTFRTSATSTFDSALSANTIFANGSGGLLLEASGGTDIGVLGSSGTANVTWYGSHNYDASTANTIAGFGASKTLGSLSTSTYPSLTELSYVKGVTSAVQTQLDGKQATLTTGNLTANSPLSFDNTRQVIGGAAAVSIADAVANGSTKGAASFTANDFDSSSGNISIDYTNGQAASAGAKGFLTSADWSTFNSKLSAAITSLNGLTGASQTFTTSTATSTFGFGSTGTTHTLTIPSNVGFFSNDAGYLTGNQSITLSGDVSGTGSTAITTTYNGIVPVSKGGTGTSTTPTALKLLTGNGTGYDLLTLTAGTNITIATTTSALTITNAITDGNYLTFSGSQMNVDAEIASSTIAFNFYDATSTAPYKFQKVRINFPATIQSVYCDEYASATTTVNLYRATSAYTNAQDYLTSIECGIAGNSTTSFSTTTIPVDTWLVANTTSTAGTPTLTTINVHIKKTD